MIGDYGAGKKRLGPGLAALPETVPPIRSYEPAVPALSSPPEPADLVVCLDVLEHVEPDCIEAVIEDLARVARRHLLASIASGPYRRTLDGGRHAQERKSVVEGKSVAVRVEFGGYRVIQKTYVRKEKER